MAALPTTNTARFVVDYEWRGIPYKTLYRFPEGVTETEAAGYIDTFHTAVWGGMEATAKVLGSATLYAHGSHVGVPAAVAAITGGTAGVAYDESPNATQFQFVARDFLGHRCSWYYQGVAVPQNHKQRYSYSDSSRVGAFLDAFNAFATSGLCTISGTRPYWKQYANVVVNDYLTHKARRG